jgi:hypothetical protein
MMSANNQLDCKKLEAQLVKALRAKLGKIERHEKKGYVRIAQGQTTVAYINVQQRGLRVDVPKQASFKIASADDIAAVVAALHKEV